MWAYSCKFFVLFFYAEFCNSVWYINAKAKYSQPTDWFWIEWILFLQQAKVIEDSTDFKVGIYCGKSNRLKTHSSWEKEIEQYEVVLLVN